jgi:hypothetical protein
VRPPQLMEAADAPPFRGRIRHVGVVVTEK